MDFCVRKVISAKLTKVEPESSELLSDHTAVLMTLSDQVKLNDENPFLPSKKTNC